MNMKMKFQDRLLEINACHDAVEWVGDRTAEEAWHECERGDWMLWLAGKLDIDRKLLVLAACDCVERALDFAGKYEAGCRASIKTTKAWCNGKATIEEVRAAASAAAYAYAAYASAASAADAAASASAIDAAASASAIDAAAAADAAASLKHSAELVRARIPFDVIKDAINEMEK